MKTLAVSILCLASVALADDFKTVDGKEYKNAKVNRVEPDGLVLITKSGISKVYFTELPKEVQERFHYDPQKAAEFTSQTIEQNRLWLQQRAEEEQKGAEERKKYWSEHPAPVQVEQQPVSASMHGGALDQPSGPTLTIYGTVSQIVDQGILLYVREVNLVGTERIPEGAPVLVIGNFPGVYDQDRVQVTGRLIGPYEYTTVSGYKATARALAGASVTKVTYFPY